MSIISPSVTPTSDSVEEYRQQLDRVSSFAHRIQIDLMDGQFAKPKVIDVADIWWPHDIEADIHLMYQQPTDYIDTLISLRPSLVIIHAEADGDLQVMMSRLQEVGIRVGVALLQETSVDFARSLIAQADHALLFSGHLGSFGGVADLGLLEKVTEIRLIKPSIEIGWDGGANTSNVSQLSSGGVDVINVGGSIQNAQEPKAMFDELTNRLSSAGALL